MQDYIHSELWEQWAWKPLIMTDMWNFTAPLLEDLGRAAPVIPGLLELLFLDVFPSFLGFWFGCKNKQQNCANPNKVQNEIFMQSCIRCTEITMHKTVPIYICISINVILLPWVACLLFVKHFRNELLVPNIKCPHFMTGRTFPSANSDSQGNPLTSQWVGAIKCGTKIPS